MSELGRWQPSPVEDFDHPTRFLVKSLSRPAERHLVDLSAHFGNGECSCEDFTMKKLKRLKMGEPMSSRTICKHIEAATFHFCRKVTRNCRDESGPVLTALRQIA